MRSRHNGWQRLRGALVALSVSSGLGLHTAHPASALVSPVAQTASPSRVSRVALPPRPGLALRPVLPTTASVPAMGATTAVSGTSWIQQAELTSTAQTPNDGYGSPVALSGNTAVVGASNTPFQSDYGAVYIFTRTASGIWSQQAELVDPQYGQGHSDMFGTAVALQGNLLVVGALNATGPVSYTGAAYVYVRSGSAWRLQAMLTARDAAYNDAFGSAVALSGATLVVGAFGKNNAEGAAYVFVYRGGAWRQQAEFQYPGHIILASFGLAVAVWGNTVVVGAPLAPVAFLYARSGTTWRLQAILAAPHPGYLLFGRSVAIWGGTVLVGASSDDAYLPGAVYVFGYNSGTWTLQTTLTPPATPPDPGFGFSVGLNRATAVVGGDGALVFVGSGATWTQTQLIPSDRAANMIGYAVAVNGNTALVGATATPPAGYVFVRSGTDWNVEDTTDTASARAHRTPATALAAPNQEPGMTARARAWRDGLR